MAKYDHYTFRVTWSDEDQEFVGLCAEFPGLSHLDASRETALKGIVDLVTWTVDDMIKDGETPPEPIADKHFSGKFQVRIPPDQHRRLAIEAAEAGVSLNRFVSSKLT